MAIDRIPLSEKMDFTILLYDIQVVHDASGKQSFILKPVEKKGVQVLNLKQYQSSYGKRLVEFIEGIYSDNSSVLYVLLQRCLRNRKDFISNYLLTN